MPQALHQFEQWSRHFCISRESDDLPTRVMSSANIKSLIEVFLQKSRISLMYSRNRTGPETLPCGTPDVTGQDGDNVSPMRTRKVRPDRNSAYQSQMSRETPYACSLCRRER